jgi:preprotein translocase subunit SecA
VYEKRRKILTGTDEDVITLWNEIFEKRSSEEQKMIEDKKVMLPGQDFTNVLRQVMLQSMDIFWIDHLELMDYSRQSVNLRAYGQRDPLVEYRKEGLRLYKEMSQATEDEVVKIMMHFEIKK